VLAPILLGPHNPAMPVRPPPHSFLASVSIMSLVGGIGGVCRAEAQMVAIPVDTTVLSAVLAADNRRDGSEESLTTLLAGSQAADQLTRRIAVRALGRMERPEWIPHIRPSLTAEMHEVRQEAVSAIGQAAFRRGADTALALLRSRIDHERHPAVLGALARTIGSLNISPSEAGLAESAILLISGLVDSTAPPDPGQVAIGVAAGLEALARRTWSAGGWSPEAVRALRTLVRFGLQAAFSDTTIASTRVRRLATSALVTRGPVDRAFFESAIADPDPGVRRLAFRGLGALPSGQERSELIMGAPMDSAWSVRYEILRAYGAQIQSTMGCVPVVDGLNDTNPHVFLLALDLLGAACPPDADALRILRSLVSALPANRAVSSGWQFPTHALLTMSRMAPALAGEYLSIYAQHPQWQVRMYAARAARILGEDSVLVRLARDEHPNVTEAALRGLHERLGHEADRSYVEALAASDYQLLKTASEALMGSPMGEAVVPTLVVALMRVTRDGKETSRDARIALLVRIGELGGPSDVAAVRSYLMDFDSSVADSAAAILAVWTGEQITPHPESLPPYSVPSIVRIAELAAVRVVIEMRDGKTFELGLRPFDAPTNADRFARLAERGYFDGLSFHRVEPNFVIQGGSPGANEYSGDGSYTRDELTDASHWRGTVGLSTRGRNTGDGQIFVNLIDNVRLDHNYTIFGQVVRGMDVVDDVLEGDVIERITITRKER